MNASDLGEFGLIERLAHISARTSRPGLVLGIGDDAAVWRFGDEYLLATTDTMVEGVHFLPDIAFWCDIGWKALAVNLSDVAAMGGEPLFALVTLALSPSTGVEAVDQLYAGLTQCAEQYHVSVAGGDIVSAPNPAITIALIGRAQTRDGAPLLLRRDAARSGDAIAVTGTLGDSAAGLRRLREGANLSDALVRAHLRPVPHVALAAEAARLGITCAIDVSDGLLQDIGHICEMSGVGARIRASSIALSEELRRAYPDEALELACTGGEDYQLVLVGAADRIALLHRENGALTVIGEVVAGDRHVALLDDAGLEMPLEAAGWDHLRAR